MRLEMIRTRSAWIVVLFGFMLIAGRALAEEHTALWGFDATCGTWVKERQTPSSTKALQLQAWLLGYLSGLAASGAYPRDVLRRSNPDGATGWIDNYCREHPLEGLPYAALLLMIDIAKAVGPN